MDVEDALTKLRAADPAAGLDGTWDGRAPLARPEPTPPSRARRWAPVLGAAAAVAAIAVALVVLPRDHTNGGPIAAPGPSGAVPSGATATPSDRTPPSDTTAGRRAAALELARSLVAAAPVYPGARRVATAPNERLQQAFQGTAERQEAAHAIWVAGGTLDQVVGWYTAHPGAGWTQPGSASGSDPRGVEFRGLDFTAGDATVLLTATPLAHSVGFRIDATVPWTPVRPSWDHLGPVTKVAVAVHRGDGVTQARLGAPTVRRTLSAAAATALARLVDGLPISDPAPRMCANARANYDDILRFSTAAGPATALVTTSGCAGVVLTYPDGRRSTLDPGGVDAAVLTALGLPRNYGWR